MNYNENHYGNAFQNLNMLCNFADNLNYTNPYKKIIYVRSTNEYIDFISKSLMFHKFVPSIALLGRINHDFAATVFYETGLNITSYRLLIESETIYHIYQKHYKEELSRPIDLNVLVYFGTAISNYFASNFYAKTERLEVFSEINEVVYKIILAIDFRHANVYLVTLFRVNEEVEKTLECFLNTED